MYNHSLITEDIKYLHCQGLVISPINIANKAPTRALFKILMVSVK